MSELKRAIKTYAVGASTSIPVENFREAVELSGLGLPARVIMDVCDACVIVLSFSLSSSFFRFLILDHIPLLLTVLRTPDSRIMMLI